MTIKWTYKFFSMQVNPHKRSYMFRESLCFKFITLLLWKNRPLISCCNFSWKLFHLRCGSLIFRTYIHQLSSRIDVSLMSDSSTWAGLRFFKMISSLYQSSRLQNSPYNFGKDNLLLHGNVTFSLCFDNMFGCIFLQTLHSSAECGQDTLRFRV